MPRVLRRPLALVLVCLAVIAVLAVLVRGSNVVTRWDASIVDDIAAHRTAGVVDLARAITNLGDGLVLTIVLAVAVIGLRVAGVLSVRAAIAPLVSLAAGVVLAPSLKAIVERPRPPLALHEVVERSSGFPSGHSTQAAAGWLALGLVLALAPGRGRAAGQGQAPGQAARQAAAPEQGAGRAPGPGPNGSGGLVRRWPLVLTGLIVALVGISRVTLSVHSPTDVLAGWLLGLACAVTVVGLLLRAPSGTR